MGDDSIQIEYNRDLQALEVLLSEVKRPGDYFVTGMREIPMPKVTVDGVGVLSFPVPSAQIKTLIGQATRAPYGRGEETILDETVRKVWQLPPEKVQISGKSWATNFAGILEQVAAGLGCEGMAVSAELYKLLVYDTGGFFLVHRDTEKAEGMFGTLVLALPSAHAGGELLIRHAGREARVDLSRAEFSELAFVAFFADCEHEVRPITQGNRVCLVYNLTLNRGGKSQGKPLSAPDYEAQISTAASLLKEKLHAPDAPTKVVWLLEHHYSPDGLSFAGLKSADAARANVLSAAAERAGCAAHLCLMHIEESGIAQELYHDYRSRYYHEEEEDDNASGDDFEVIEVSDGRHYLSQWRDRSDRPVDFGEVPLAPGELLPAGALDDEEPDEQKLMEASGNEGASFERSYLRAALAVWLRERYTEVLLQAGPDAALPHLRECIDAAAGPSASAVAGDAAAQAALKIVEAWKTLPEYPHAEIQCEKRDEMLHLLVRLGDVALIEEFIREVVISDYDGTENDALVASAPLLPPTRIPLLYCGIVHRHMRHRYAHCIDLLHALAFEVELAKVQARKGALGVIAGGIVNELKEAARPAKQTLWMESSERKKARPVDTELVRKLMEALGKLGATPLRDLAVQRFADRCEIFDPVSVLIPALPLLQEPDGAARRLWENCAQFVLQRSEHPPEAPRDWRQEANLACSCADCRELRAFALDPVEQVHRFRIRQDRRQHLHSIIESHSLDMTHETERKGSPQTLVCTKTHQSYRRRCEQYRKDITGLETLAQQAGRHCADSGTLNRIKAACERKTSWTPA